MSFFDRFRLAESKPRPDTTERGHNAVSWRLGTRSTLRDPEYKYELQGRQGGRIYQRMRFSDPHIAGLRRAQNLPLLRASASIEPADPKNEDAVAKAKLVDRLLLKDFPWRAFLQDTMLALDYGFAPFEIVWRIEDGEARFRLALRPADSIAADDIEVADGGVARITQRPDTGGTFEIPGEKLVWFCHEKEGDNFLGRPILRAMYKPWKIKEDLEVQLPELIRKLGGIPNITTDDEPSDELKAELDASAEAFGTQAGGFFRHTSEVTVELLTGDASVQDVLAAIQQRNTEITSVCQAQVFDLGNANNGSRALGTTLADLFSSGIQALANYREDVINARGGLIHQCIAYNFPRDDNLPALRFGNVQQADMTAFAAALVNLQRAFQGLDEETEEWARQQLNMPEATTTQTVVPTDKVPAEPEPPENPTPAPPAPSPAAKGPDEGEGEGGAKASEGHGGGWQLGEGRKLSRGPRGVECFVQLAEIDARFDDGKTAVRVATQATRDRLISEVVRRATEAQERGTLAQFAAGAPPMVESLTRDVRRVLAEFYQAGRDQVRDELQRQRDGQPVTQEVVDARQSGERALAEKKPPRKAMPLPDPDDAIDEQAAAMARSIAGATQAAAAQNAARVAAGVPLEIGAFEEAVMRESDAAALRFGAVVGDLMSLGRAAEAQEQAKDVEDGVYSAILDSALCEECEARDGEVTTDLAEAAGWTPNPDCQGGRYCRCVVVYELRQGGE